ncbi:DUF5336 domain-containing protein [Mycolicibacterium arenosum]|uniref:DUF5336 domain-containing protein n=1 Tax=Mycolicibacterium arenosum TaxID=2952157 RepID=A0ABT1LXE7_9MYCO|nr:DUF5336 domain-containing protein [Mycolicibacterium sp. CAU 1645]MCP9271571.1 DUF5336 domain-containing protein [Mycolicibacterium sp. CAU 1645]
MTYWYEDVGRRAPTRDEGGILIGRYLAGAVAVFGLAIYLLSFNSPVTSIGADWAVRFALLAGIAAAVSLAPGRRAPLAVMVCLAAVGFLDALSRYIGAALSDWAVVVIVVLAALQTVAAAIALVAGESTTGDQAPVAADPYAYYAYYAAAAEHGYGQYPQPPTTPETAAETATADGDAAVHAGDVAARYAESAHYWNGEAATAATPTAQGAPAQGVPRAQTTSEPVSRVSQSVDNSVLPIRPQS